MASREGNSIYAFAKPISFATYTVIAMAKRFFFILSPHIFTCFDFNITKLRLFGFLAKEIL